MADVKLPLVGPVSKKWIIIVGAGSAATIGYIYFRKRSASSSAATGASSATDGQIDPLTGDIAGSAQDQVDLANLQAGGGYGLGMDGTGLGYGFGGGGFPTPPASTIPGAGGFTTNGEWAQQAETDLGGIGIDPVALSAALGAYLTARQLTPAQQGLVDQAIAQEDYPPVSGPGGYPPAMHTQSTISGGGQPPPFVNTVKVPRVIGDRVENANSVLQSLGLKSSFGHRNSGVPYVVTGQSPEPGKTVTVGSTVHLTIAAQSQAEVIPGGPDRRP